MVMFVFRDLDLETPVGKSQINLVRKPADLVIGDAPGRVELAAQRAHLVRRGAQSFRRPIRQRIVVIVEAGEGRRHRPARVNDAKKRSRAAAAVMRVAT